MMGNDIVRRLAFRARLLWEKVRGVDFMQSVSVEGLGLPADRAHHYSSSANRYLDRVLASLAIRSSDSIVDFGCGKGAALVRLAKFPFDTVEGVELSGELAGIARNNMARLRLHHVVIHQADAAAFTELDRFRFFYFFNPFPCGVMKEVMENIRASLIRCPREATIIYRNPKCHEEVLASDLFRKTGEFPTEQDFPFFIYRSTHGADKGTNGGRS